MIWTGVAHGAEMLEGVRQQTYAYAPSQSIEMYFQRVPMLILYLLGTAVGSSWIIWLVAGFAVVRHDRPGGASVLAGPSKSFLVCVLLIPPALLPLITPSYAPRYLTFLLPVVYVWTAVALMRLWDQFRSRPLPSSCDRKRDVGAARVWMMGLVLVFAGFDGLIIGGVHRYLTRRGETNAAFFELRKALAESDACRDGVFLEDLDGLKIPTADRAWVHFNFQSVRYVLMMSSCPVTLAPVSSILEMINIRSSEAWLIIPDQSVSTISQGWFSTPVMAVAPGPPISAQFRLTLFHVRPRAAPSPPQGSAETLPFGRTQ
jgi:hypothetical protein